MGLVTVYDADGVEYKKETVDARECVEHLSFTYEKLEYTSLIIEESIKPIKQKKFKEELAEELVI